MKTFLFIILSKNKSITKNYHDIFFMTAAILVQHSIQYENGEEGNLLHPEKPPEKREEHSYNLRKGDIKYLLNIKDYDTGDFQPYNQNYYRELKDKELMQPLRELRSASEIKNFVKDMIAMRLKGRRPYRPPHTTKKPRPPQTTKKPKPNQTTEKSKDDSRDSIDIHLKVKIRGNKDVNSKEEQILLEYTPKHKKVDVPMIIFVPSSK